VIAQLQRRWPNLAIAIEPVHTRGDRVVDRPLAQIGGDGVFIAEIERALLERRIDLAVHSLKDLPTTQPDGLRLAVIGPREDARDVLISRIPCTLTSRGLSFDGEDGATPVRIGTCSLRRAAQLRWLCSQVEILPIRGNVDTRLHKLEAGEYDAIVLAAAGLHRLELPNKLADRLTYFPLARFLPAPGQGALAVEARDESPYCELLAPLDDVDTRAAVSAERAFMRTLGAGCYLPVAAYGEVSEGTLSLTGLVAALDGQFRVLLRQELPWTEQSSIEQAEGLGRELAEQAVAYGADGIIQSVRTQQEQHYA
jgi:hydroxymethylbilane synthase